MLMMAVMIMLMLMQPMTETMMLKGLMQPMTDVKGLYMGNSSNCYDYERHID